MRAMISIRKRHVAILALTSLVLTSLAIAYPMGERGNDGEPGGNGSTGRIGGSVVVVADGSNANLNLNGLNASRGGNGQTGGDAVACQFYHSDYNFEGAAGGDGGNGGTGGSGGAGGNLTVYYADPSLLRSILVSNSGGKGAAGGAGGAGGTGCKCGSSSWTVQVCQDQQVDGSVQRVCHDETRYCTDGKDGSPGSHGGGGTTGERGLIYALRGLTSMPVETPTAAVDLVAATHSITQLSKRNWLHQTGAQTLFAPGSDISDSYFEFDRVLQAQANLIWNTSRPVSDFAGQKITYSFDGGKVSASLSNGIWASIQSSATSGATTFIINTAIRASEARQVSVEKLEGSGEDLKIVLKDTFGASDFVKTGAFINLETSNRLGIFRPRFYGAVPAQLIQVISPTEVHLLIGKLPKIAKAAKRFAAGKKIRYALEVTRELGASDSSIDFESPKKLRIPE